VEVRPGQHVHFATWFPAESYVWQLTAGPVAPSWRRAGGYCVGLRLPAHFRRGSPGWAAGVDATGDPWVQVPDEAKPWSPRIVSLFDPATW
jgi:hypothetical protein